VSTLQAARTSIDATLTPAPRMRRVAYLRKVETEYMVCVTEGLGLGSVKTKIGLILYAQHRPTNLASQCVLFLSCGTADPSVNKSWMMDARITRD
jgi:hypothetical protein